MKAAILVKSKSSLVIADLTLPEKLDYGQVLVRVHYSGICGAQINEIEAVKGPDRFLPHLLGHEGGGVVENVGPGVTTVKKGDHVVMHWMKGAGIESATPKYKWGDKTVNAGWVTTFNEYAVVSENRVTAIPKTYDLKSASLYGCALTTAFGVMENNARIKAGESLVVFGSGGVGSAIIMAAAVCGANPIVAVDINTYKLRKAKIFGATHTVNSSGSNFLAELYKISPPGGFDVAVDTTGIKRVREMAYEITHGTGRTVLVGVPPKGQKIEIDSFQLHFGKYITGSHGGDTRPERDIPRLIRMEKSDVFNGVELITHEFELADINKAIRLVKHGNVVRCVVKIVR